VSSHITFSANFLGSPAEKEEGWNNTGNNNMKDNSKNNPKEPG
jgi:hypothetical protein